MGSLNKLANVKGWLGHRICSVLGSLISQHIVLHGSVDCLQDSLAVLKVGVSNGSYPKMGIDNDLQVVGLEIRPVTSERSASIGDHGGARRSYPPFDIVHKFRQFVRIT